MSSSTSLAATGASPARAHSQGIALPHANSSDGPIVRILRGREAILAAQPQLAALARSTSQTGEADSLGYFLSTPNALKKIHHLLLIHDSRTSGLVAAVRLFEYKTVFGPTRVFTCDDSSGRRNVLAPPGLRARYATIAARTLIGRGAHIVQISFSDGHHDGVRVASAADQPNAGGALQTVDDELRRSPGAESARRVVAQWTLYEKDLPSYLALLPTFDATLARIGSKTRTNLRYYRRRCELELGAYFVPDAALSLTEFLAFNRECSFAVDEKLAAFRYRMLTTQPTCLLRGVRDARGRWLSLVGIRRQNGFVEMDWQMNRAGLPRASLATVLRSYLIEYEIGLGSTRLYMEGGTAQAIGHSFLRERVAELTMKRGSSYVRLLERFGPSIFPPQNSICDALRNPQLQWRPW
jgi:hypothetical protein